ncbi:hypothetical protein [Helicobacter suis]|uniref:hypothetical protein n=1 Tax=Helicobacter suis TaxID=104628 RepID=UPI0013CFDA27|nr:hypothetical protein [Helicobacter suis]
MAYDRIKYNQECKMDLFKLLSNAPLIRSLKKRMYASLSNLNYASTIHLNDKLNMLQAEACSNQDKLEKLLMLQAEALCDQHKKTYKNIISGGGGGGYSRF